MNVYIKVIGTHALIVGGIAAAATVIVDVVKLAQAPAVAAVESVVS